MKTKYLAVLILSLSSISAFAEPRAQNTLICADDTEKLALVVGYGFMYRAEPGTPDAQVISYENSDEEDVVTFDPIRRVFEVDGSNECVGVTYKTQVNSASGQPELEWTNLDDRSTGTIACHWVSQS